MRNVPIIGGRTVGPPLDWDSEARGECLTLSALIQNPPYPDMASTTTAWQFEEAELNALAAGGHFFLATVLPYIPVIRLHVQDADGGPVSELSASVIGIRHATPPVSRAEADRMRDVAASLRAAIITIGQDIERRVMGAEPQDQDWLGADNAGIVERLAKLAALIPDAKARQIPILTLDDLVRGDMKGRPFAGTPADPAVQADLEQRLGVELNPGDATDPEPSK